MRTFIFTLVSRCSTSDSAVLTAQGSQVTVVGMKLWLITAGYIEGWGGGSSPLYVNRATELPHWYVVRAFMNGWSVRHVVDPVLLLSVISTGRPILGSSTNGDRQLLLHCSLLRAEYLCIHNKQKQKQTTVNTIQCCVLCV